MYKKYVILIGILLLMFSLCSCNGYISPGINDFSCKLSGDYTLYHAHETYVTKNTKENSTKFVIDDNVIGIACNDEDYVKETERLSNLKSIGEYLPIGFDAKPGNATRKAFNNGEL